MAHDYKFNAEAFAAALTATIDSFGFTSTHEGRVLGEIIVDEIIEGIQERSVDRQCDGSGTPWPENSDATRRRKYRQWGEALINKDTGQMLSALSLRGTTTITQYLVRMEYGTGEAPANAPGVRVPAGGGEHAYEQVTDIDKAVYAVADGRSFYELDDAICTATFDRFSETLREHMANPGR